MVDYESATKLTLARHVSSVARARNFVRDAIGDTEIAECARLLVSELAANAVLHGSGDTFEVDVHSDGIVRIGVHDESPVLPTLVASPTNALGGRGLRIVDGLASKWGVDRGVNGKTVWFELASVVATTPAVSMHARLEHDDAARLETLQSLTARLARITSSAEMASFVLNEGVSRLGGTSGSLCLVADDELELTATFGYPSDVIGAFQRFPIDGTTPAGECAMTRLPVYCESLDELFDRYPIFREGPIVGDPSVAVLPLQASDASVLGTMVVGFAAPQHFDAPERALLEAIAREAAVALERARANEALIEARDQLAFLAEASARLSASLDLEETMGNVAMLAVPRIADRCALYLLDEQTEIRKFALAPNLTDDEQMLFSWSTPTLKDADGVGAVIRTGRSVFVPVIDERAIEAVASSAEHLDLLRRVGFGGTFIVSLSLRGKQLGALAFVNRTGRSFLGSERVLAEELAARCAVAIDNAQLFARELGIAETLQRALLPAKLPSVAGVTFATRYVPGSDQLAIGGDWYSAIAIDDHRFAIVVGDVSGRGLHAATTMASVRYTIRTLAFEGNSPDDVLRKCGMQLDIGEEGRFATVLVGVIDMASRELTMANAGHLNPILITGSDGEFLHCEPGLPIGVRKGATYRSVTVGLPSHGTLLAFTDGLVERRGEIIDVGMSRVLKSAITHQGDIDALVSAVLHEMTPDGPSDDIAILGVQWQT
jgi:GAF domain-containing protein/anti-sigma regulatory factor (Ser/Thr protein kinase)